MRYSNIILALAAGIPGGLAFAAADVYTLETDYLCVSVLPESSGRIVSVYDKQRGIEHFEALEENTDVLSPLVPPRVQSNQAGVKDWFWGQRNPSKVGFQLAGKGESEAGPWLEVTGIVNGVEVLRRVTLLESAPVLMIDVRLRSDKEQTVSYWTHLLVAGAIYLDVETGNGLVAGAWSTDSAPRQGRSIFTPPKAGVQKMETRIGDYALSPAGRWFVRLAPDRPLGLALLASADFTDGEGFFYTWQDGSQGIVTLEAIWPARQIGPEQEAYVSFYLIVVDDSDPGELAAYLETFEELIRDTH